MKKILTFVFIFASLALYSFSTKNSSASSCSNYGGATTYCDDGTSYSNYGGSTTYGSDGTSYSNYGGATTYGSDGSSQSNYGGSTTYGSDGTSYSNYGGSTIYGSDGSTYNDYGGSTTYGSGSGKMIKIPNSDDSDQRGYGGSTNYGIGDEKTTERDAWDSSGQSDYGNDTTYPSGESSIIYRDSENNLDKGNDGDVTEGSENKIYEVNGIKYSERDLQELGKIRRKRNREMCPLNAVYISSIQKCECIFRYKYDGSSCVYNGSSDNYPTIEIEPIKSPDSVQSLDANLNNAQVNQDMSVTNLKTQNKAKNLVWWNPLTWWSHFYNK